jgi:hypothetical protein
MDLTIVDRWFLIFLVIVLVGAVGLISKLCLAALKKIYEGLTASIFKLESSLEKTVGDFKEALREIVSDQRGSNMLITAQVTDMDKRLFHIQGEHDRCMEDHAIHKIAGRVSTLEAQYLVLQRETIFGRRATDYPRDGIPHPYQSRETWPVEEGDINADD